jgi:hypothetical protein
MNGQVKPLFAGKMRVIIPQGLSGYEVYEKDYPASLKNSPDFSEYEWVGNFGLKDNRGNVLTGKLGTAYEVQVLRRDGKKLVYWDGSKTVEFTSAHGLKDVQDGNQNYKAVNLDLGDPPFGWG